MRAKQISVVTNWWPILVVVITTLTTAGFTWGLTKSDIEQIKAKSIERDGQVSGLEKRVNTIEKSSGRTDRNIVKIGQALHIEVELPKD